MSRKLSYEYVKEYFKKHNCTVLEDEYIDSRTPMKYVCSCGNISRIRFNNFQQGQRCINCGRKSLINKQKYSQETVEKIFKQNNCVLLGVYINSKTPVEYMCSCGSDSMI